MTVDESAPFDFGNKRRRVRGNPGIGHFWLLVIGTGLIVLLVSGLVWWSSEPSEAEQIRKNQERQGIYYRKCCNER